MASFYGYTILIVGLSILLAIAGMGNVMGHISGKYFSGMQNPDGSFNATNIDGSNFGSTGSGDGSDLFGWMLSILGITGLVTLGIAAATRNWGEVLKAGFAASVLILGISDFWSLLSYAINDPSFGGIAGIIACIIYIPLGIGYIITAINWVGGKD